MKNKITQLRHKATGKTALVQKAPSACLLAQFDDTELPQAFGWHLYPRSAFARAYSKRRHEGSN